MTPRRTYPHSCFSPECCCPLAQAATIQITIQNHVNTPAEVSAKVGDTIVWINKDILAHHGDREERRLGRDDRPKQDRQVVAQESRHRRITTANSTRT